MSKVITISIEDEAVATLRRIALNKYGKRKGALGKVASEAIMALSEKDRSEMANKSALERLKKGYKMGKLLYKNRSELHER